MLSQSLFSPRTSLIMRVLEPSFSANNFSHVVFTLATVTFFGNVRFFDALPLRDKVSANDIEECVSNPLLFSLSFNVSRSSSCCDCVLFVICTPANALSPCRVFKAITRGCRALTSKEANFASNSFSSSFDDDDVDDTSATTLRRYLISLSLRSFSVTSDAFN